MRTSSMSKMTANRGRNEIPPTVAVGKNGVTDNVIAEIVRQLRTRRTVKVRLHGESKLSRFEIAKELADKSGAKLIDVRGFTVLLTRKKTKL